MQIFLSLLEYELGQKTKEHSVEQMGLDVRSTSYASHEVFK